MSPDSDPATIEFLPDADEIERRPLPPFLRLTLHFMLLALISAIVWASLSEIDVNVVARGRLVMPLPNIVVQPLETSIIQSIDVRIGQIVKKGERLATLDPTFSEADESQLRSRQQSLENEVQRLQAELDGRSFAGTGRSDSDNRLQNQLSDERQASYRAQSQRIDETIARLRASMETNRQDQKALQARISVLKESVDMQENLVEKKYAVRGRLLDAQDRLLEVERSLEMARNRENELRRDLLAAEAEKRSFGTGWRQKTMEALLAVSRERDALNEQLQKADRRSKLVTLTSPSDAVVLEIGKLSQGSVVRGAETLFTLVPLGGELEAEVQIDSLDVGYLKAGDVAQLKFDAFPFQKHGTLPAKLKTISEDAFRRESNTSGMETYYLSRMSLDKLRLKNMPERARLLPGMTVSAEIVVGKRSVMSYVFWPLVKALNESIREPG